MIIEHKIKIYLLFYLFEKSKTISMDQMVKGIAIVQIQCDQ